VNTVASESQPVLPATAGEANRVAMPFERDSIARCKRSAQSWLSRAQVVFHVLLVLKRQRELRSHSELIAAAGTYAELYERQARAYA